jgi:hypothetical protein
MTLDGDGCKPVRARRGGKIHATDDYRATLCARSCDGWPLGTEIPTCKQCLRVLADRAV